MISIYAPILLLATRSVFSSESSKAKNVKEPAVPICEANTFTLADVVPGVKILSVTTASQKNYSTAGGIYGLPTVQVDDFCQVKISYTHTGSDDKIETEVWLPSNHGTWNGRYQAAGGGGYLTGLFDELLGPAVNNGYAASSTDGGHDRKNANDLTWALKANGKVNLDILHTAFTSSLAEQVLFSKKIVEQFYSEKPRYSYWVGCSQGGRQGYMMAQQYPDLLDGILANAPAISLTHIVMGDLWPQIVMKEAGYWMSGCEFEFFRQQAIEACDMLDGVSDGVISDPDICDFDPLHVIGKTFHCDGKDVEVTPVMAKIVQMIQQGPRTPFKKSIWHGFPWTTNLQYVAGTADNPAGMRTALPFPISASFFNTLLLEDPSFNVTKLSYADFMALWAQASYNYGWLFDSDNPNLNAFKASGGKLLTWHGINDHVIPYGNTVRYRERVEHIMGGAHEVDQFYRLFLAPGVNHCHGGVGPVPEDPLNVLVDWVEKNEPPEVVPASTKNKEGELVTRDLCAWPGKAKYMGLGDAKRASSWSCAGGTERPEVEDKFGERHREQRPLNSRAGDVLGGLKDRLEGLGLGLKIG